MAKKQQTVHQIKILGLNDIKALNVEISKLAGNYEELKGAADDAKKPLNDTGKNAGGAAKGIGMFAKGAVAATAALVAFNKISKVVTQQLRQGIDVFKGYEFEMQKVKAISGANEREFKKLDKTAQQLGRSTFFTAQQVAALQLNFSKLGFTSAEVLQVQEAALTAATATGEDLARTATVIGSTVRGFGLDATQGARVADVMAASFTSSALTLEKFQTSMTKVSPVAKLLGMDLEETTAVMGVLTDAGIEASIAGTSLRNIFLKLGDPSSDLAKSIGFTVNSGEDMVREFRRMRDEGVNVEKMLEVVDVRQVAAISTMIEHIDKIESQTEAFRNSSGAAQNMADIIQNSLQGATLRFQSALDGLRIVLFEKIAPVLQSTINSLADFFNIIAKGQETPMSEMLEKDRLKLIEYKVALFDSNLEQEDRIKLINKLKTLHPNHLQNINAETVSNQQLTTSLNELNDALINQILLKEQDEKADKKRAELNQRKIDKRKQEVLVTEQISKVVDKYNLVLEDGLSIDEQVDNLLKQKPARYGRLLDPMTELSHQANELEIIQQNINHLSNQENDLFKDKIDLMHKLGMVVGEREDADAVFATPTNETTVTGESVPALAGDDDKIIEDAKSILQMEMAIANERQELLTQYADGEIKTRADLNDKLKEMELEHIEFVLDANMVQGDALIELERRKAKVKADIRKDEQKADVDRIKQLKETGRLLMQIGEQEGENSKIRKVGIKITQAAAIAEGIKGLIDSSSGIAAQAKLVFPKNIIAMAATAAQVASVVANIKALIGGGGGETAEGGGGVSTSQDVQFEQGGLTRGGMFVGNSHANGGVKFRVGGRIMEAEGGEAIINKKSTSMFRPVLSAINSYNGNGVKFADGGLLNSGEKFAMGGELRSAQQLISGGTGSSKVVIVESDMTEVQNRISAIESQATF